MSFRFEKLTTKAQEAVSAAQANALASGHAEIGTLHLLNALLEERDGVIRPLLDKMKGSC